MADTAKLIGEYGILVVIAAIFLYTYIVDRKDRRDERKSLNAATLGFIDTANAFNVTVANHMTHAETSYKEQGEALRDLTRAIERLCIYMEMPNHDYRREGTDD